jgi:hypothetical protein
MPPRSPRANNQEVKDLPHKRTTAGCSCSGSGGSVAKPLRQHAYPVKKPLQTSHQMKDMRRMRTIVRNIRKSKLTPSSFIGKNLKRKGKILKKKSLFKKGKNPMVRVMSYTVDDVINTNSVIFKALSGDFTRESIREVMTLVKDAEAEEGSNEHYIATQLIKNAANREIFLTFETNEGMLN